MMQYVETYKVDAENRPITPEMLKANPDKYGGLSLHMLSSIQKGVVTVPLHNGCTYVSIPVPAEAAMRIVADGEIRIESNAYWCNICSAEVKRYFKDSQEEIPTITTFLTR